MYCLKRNTKVESFQVSQNDTLHLVIDLSEDEQLSSNYYNLLGVHDYQVQV